MLCANLKATQQALLRLKELEEITHEIDKPTKGSPRCRIGLFGPSGTGSGDCRDRKSVV